AADSVCQAPWTRVSIGASPWRVSLAWRATAAISDRRSSFAGSKRTRTLPVVELAWAWRTPRAPVRRAARRAAYAGRPRKPSTCRRARPSTATKTIRTTGDRDEAGEAGESSCRRSSCLAGSRCRFPVEDEAPILEVAVDFRLIRPVPGRRRLEQDVG